MNKNIITNISDFLNEKKNNNSRIIYHFTESIDSLISILNGDSLIQGSNKYNNHGLGYDNISFTWNPNLWDIEYAGDIDKRWKVRISFDYDRMSKKWEFKPFDYGIPEEMEEIVEIDEIYGIVEYITEITLSSKEDKNDIKYLKEKYPNIKIKTVRR